METVGDRKVVVLNWIKYWIFCFLFKEKTKKKQKMVFDFITACASFSIARGRDSGGGYTKMSETETGK